MTGCVFDSDGRFTLEQADRTSHLYFPLANAAGMLSCVTPLLHGDCKTGQNSFLLAPVSVDDLHNTRSARNFWVRVEGLGAWSATGGSAAQTAGRFEEDERVTVEGGFLWHRVTRASARFRLTARITSLVPASEDKVELMCVELTNSGSHSLDVTPIAAIPLYGRSADNLRDHRHVTSLLHRIAAERYGVVLKPTLSFDERGHHANRTQYAVLGAEGDGTPPAAFCPILHDFIGEGGSLDWPEAVIQPCDQFRPAPIHGEGYEAIGALAFSTVTLAPGESRSYILILGIGGPEDSPESLIKKYGRREAFDRALEECEEYWRGQLHGLEFKTGDEDLNHWLQWVTLQPILRRLFGNSFLPYHDYGRGGRGWRDLWQDCLALLLLDPDRVPDLLAGYIAGVRSDGSNATIIGSRPGEFVADRNNIARIWMDHGAWPLLTVKLYIDQTGDLDFLLREQTYFKDSHIERSCAIDTAWRGDEGTALRTEQGEVYFGTVLEHLLIQNLTPFFNVGEHNVIRLEGGDWNDGLDMAAERGESVAFTSLYAGNLRELARLLLALDARGHGQVTLAREVAGLLDTLSEPVDYQSIAQKHQRLREFMDSCSHTISGVRISLPSQVVAGDLLRKADWLGGFLREQEWIVGREGHGWFNGYYANDGEKVEGDHGNGVRMTLTGQVFALMAGISTDAQAREVVRSARKYLYDERVGGFRLNTNFGETKMNLGRCFGFAYGTKENGAMFSHMDVMFANALYKRGLAREGYRVLDGLYRHARDFPISRCYPGVPEYFDARGRGAYPWLTGAASWYLLTLLTEAFGVRGDLGDLLLAPRLVAEQFDGSGDAAVTTLFAGHVLAIVYHNSAHLDEGQYQVANVQIDGREIAVECEGGAARLDRRLIEGLEPGAIHRVDVGLT